jgi:hypothetical protein
VKILSPTCRLLLACGRNRLASLFLIALGVAAFSASSVAAPREEITQAVVAGGATDPAIATRTVFLRAFTAVAVRVKQRDLPDYAATAIQMQPHLASKITTYTIRIMAQRDRRLSCTAVARLVSVTIAANADSAVRIAAAAIKAKPDLSSCIIAAASAAAPDQRLQIAKLESYFSLALLSLVANDSDAEPWHGSGTFNPANVLDFRIAGDVVSPEQPPSSH